MIIRNLLLLRSLAIEGRCGNCVVNLTCKNVKAIMEGIEALKRNRDDIEVIIRIPQKVKDDNVLEKLYSH